MSFKKSFFLNEGHGKLNFETEEFHSDNFSVDEFIQRKRQVVPLDVLRDDLGAHLKALRSSLIELINKDYGQFVNLSSNLVGLDGRIQSIVGPLTRTRNDIQAFDEQLSTGVSDLTEELHKRREIREAKVQIQFHQMAFTALDSSEKLMNKVPQEISSSIDFNLLRSACDEVAETKFLLQCCVKSHMRNQVELRWERVCQSVLQRLNRLFKIYIDVQTSDSVQSSTSLESVSMMKSLLYMYTELQCEAVVEDTLVREILQPKCDTVLSTKGNISALFDAIESFLSQSPLMKVWRNLEDCPWMAKYEFISKGVFPFVLGILSKKFPHIWSPSNPELFHTNWTRCEQFILTLEGSVPSLNHLENFRNSDAIKEFIAKWQFPVYFQLRFHSIVTELESALESIDAPCMTSEFKLDITRVMVKVLNQCWDKDKIYISRIAGRFLKASALVVSRYIKQVHVEVAANKSCSLHASINAYCDLNLAELVVQQILMEKMRLELNLDVLKPSESNNFGAPIPTPSNETALKFLSDFHWNQARDAIESNLVDAVVTQSSSNLSAVNEVPRLYRRTNRETPTKHLEYVEAIILPISSIKNDVINAHQRDLWDKIDTKIGNQILQRYKIQVHEVLVSVQRMEESLRRLKKVKGQNSSVGDNAKGLTDDDKIRLQIQLDVEHFTQKIKELCPAVDTLPIQSLFGNSNGKI